MTQYKSFIDPQDRHDLSCSLGFKQGIIYKYFGVDMGYRRILFFYYRNYLWWQVPFVVATSPILFLSMAKSIVIDRAKYSLPDPTVVFPRGKCYECGVNYGQGGNYEHPDIEELFHC